MCGMCVFRSQTQKITAKPQMNELDTKCAWCSKWKCNRAHDLSGNAAVHEHDLQLSL